MFDLAIPRSEAEFFFPLPISPTHQPFFPDPDRIQLGNGRVALERFGWNQTRAAAFLGLTRPTLIYRMEKYGLAKPEGA